MIRITRRTALATAAMLPCAAHAQEDWPSRAIRLVLPSAPGGSGDIIARLTAQGMSERTSAAVVVENRAGAGGVIGSEFVAGATDGHTLIFMTLSAAVLNQALQPNMRLNVRRAFTPVSLVGLLPQLIVVNPKVPANTLQELLDLMRSRPGRVTYASSGPGTILHLSGHMLATAAGATAEHVPYRGGGPAVQDVLAGNIDLLIEGFPSLLPYVRAGQLRALAIAAPQRSPNLPDLPTTDEAGLPGFHVSNWHAVFAPSTTPPAAIQKQQELVQAGMAVPAVRQRMIETGLDLVGSSSAELERFWDEQIALWHPVVRASGARAE